jgi:beta-xylosidase
MVSDSPAGPFTESPAPTLAVNDRTTVTIPNNGDETLFVDDDLNAYIVYTDWKRAGDLVIERLDASYTTGTGQYVRLGLQHVEAPALFKRQGIYYLTYSDPNCGLCGGTGTSYMKSDFPLGPWTAGAKISDDSCGGQPSHVTRIPSGDSALYLYQSDLWIEGSGNQRNANYYWGPLDFSDGLIAPIQCVRALVPPLYN